MFWNAAKEQLSHPPIQSHAKKYLEYQGQQNKSAVLPLHYADICENFMLPWADSPEGWIWL